MVDNIIVATFSNVNAAHDAARAIKDLKDAGGTKFKLKSGVIVTKDDRGWVSVLESDVHPFHGTKVGVVVGGLIGLIGGVPLATLAALLGATVGVINDAGMAILGSATVTSIKSEMQPGMTAVIIEADEASPNAVDDIVAERGGRVFREAKGTY
jgi:uncharacterized membrane protein